MNSEESEIVLGWNGTLRILLECNSFMLFFLLSYKGNDFTVVKV